MEQATSLLESVPSLLIGLPFFDAISHHRTFRTFKVDLVAYYASMRLTPRTGCSSTRERVHHCFTRPAERTSFGGFAMCIPHVSCHHSKYDKYRGRHVLSTSAAMILRTYPDVHLGVCLHNAK